MNSWIYNVLELRAASQPKCEAPLRNEVNQKRTNVRPLLSLLGSFGAIEWLSWAFFCHLHDHHKRGHLFFHGLGVSMPRPFRKGIACHGSMQACPFCYYGICCFIIWCYKCHIGTSFFGFIAMYFSNVISQKRIWSKNFITQVTFEYWRSLHVVIPNMNF